MSEIVSVAIKSQEPQIGTTCLICDGFIPLGWCQSSYVPRICEKCKRKLNRILDREKDDEDA